MSTAGASGDAWSTRTVAWLDALAGAAIATARANAGRRRLIAERRDIDDALLSRW
jgi:hypothetical protein